MNALYRIADLQIDELLTKCQEFEKITLQMKNISSY